jgi:hypothetical protein
MKKYICIIYILSSFFSVFANETNYKNISKIEMEVLRNDKVIGYSIYFFKHNEDTMTVENYTKFIVEMFGVKVFSIDSKSKEIYQKDRLMSFESTTLQNDKKKFVKLNYDEKKKKFIINGSSYVGEANLDNVIGNWWNSKILETNQQISPLSGSIKQQVITFIGKENIELYGKNYLVDHYKLKSKNQDLPDDKKLDFDIWLDKKNNLILKIAYTKMGKWEYRLKSFE